MGKRDALRKRVVLALGALIYATLYAFCSQIDETWTISWSTTAVRFAIALPVALAALLLLMRYALPRIEMKPDEKPKKPFCTWGAFLFLFCCYVPMFLIWYPGTFSYDTAYQVRQYAEVPYSTFHPLLHTLMIHFVFRFLNAFNSMELCAALYSVIQMTLAAFCFSQVCASISRSVSRRAGQLAMMFFGLYPAHMAFASSCTKDVLFSAFLAVFMALCFEELACTLTGRRRALQLVSGILACMLRNNMVYAMIVWAVMLLLARKAYRRIALCTAVSIVLAMGFNAGLKSATHATSGEIMEMFSVPLQQLARARLYAPEKFSEEELTVADTLFAGNIHEQYEPTLADPVKNYMSDEIFEDNIPAFVRTWLTVGTKCPTIYMEAFLSLALPSLYPYREYKVIAPYIEMGGDKSMTATFALPPFVRPGRFAAAREWLYENIYETGADDVPLVRLLFNTGFIYWLLLLFVLYDMYCGRWKRVLLCMLPVLLWGTYVLGPVMQGRYLYPFICMLPLFVFRRREHAA